MNRTSAAALLSAAMMMLGAGGTAHIGMADVQFREKENGIILRNEHVALTFDFSGKQYTVADGKTGEVILENAGFAADGWGASGRSEWNGWTEKHTMGAVEDGFGKGLRVVVTMEHPKRSAVPVYMFSYTLYEGRGAVVMGFGVRNNRDYAQRLMTSEPMVAAKVFPNKTIDHPLTLNGSAGSEAARVRQGLARESANSMMLTGLVDGRRRTVVWGGLANQDFGKYTAVYDLSKIKNPKTKKQADAKLDAGFGLACRAQDPVGRLVEPGQTYWSKDTFYLDVTTADPFVALEEYGRAMRAANQAHPNVYDFPVLCGWSVGAMSKLPGINNAKALVGELESAQKCGLTKYTKVGIRLEPDSYCYGDGNTEQGWWDDAHWSKFGHLNEPYTTFAAWCAAIRERDGIPYTYFQCGMPSDDYARANPGHMLANDISRLAVAHGHHQPLVSYDYTDPDFQKHMKEVWQRLRKDGIRGIKFDYPETAWRPEGGFEDRTATTASAYRQSFQLCRDGLGADAFLDERNLGESGRPCLDVTAGIVDTQRNWTDSNAYVPAMITIGGLRWYKNRTVFNYFPDTKTVHDCTPEIRQSMLTMVFLTSGRIDLATSFTLFTPEIVHDFSRIYPAYREPFTARPLDAFTGVVDPRIYDLELTADWHQVALFNTAKEPATVSVRLSGDRAATGAIGLDAGATYYVYDFWADKLVGKVPGTATVERQLGPSHCAMLSVRRVQAYPQVLSTDRHVLQGWVDLSDIAWDASAKRLGGVAKMIGGEPFRIVLAGNGLKANRVHAEKATAKLEPHAAGADYTVLVLERPENGTITWSVDFGN